MPTSSSAEGILVRTAGLEPALPFEKQIFLPLRLSPPPAPADVRGLDYPFAMAGAWCAGVRRRPSSLYTFPDRAEAYAGQSGLGSGLAWARAPLAFPEFGRFYAADFPAGTPIQSLLRLPVSPRPLQVVVATASTTRRPRLRDRPPGCPQRRGEKRPGGEPGRSRQTAAMTAISTVKAGAASFASTVARAGALPSGTQASHTAFISAKVPISAR